MPWTLSCCEGEVVPIPTFPFESMMKAVEVAEAVDVESVNRGEVFEESATTDSFAQGDVVPIPTLPVVAFIMSPE